MIKNSFMLQDCTRFPLSSYEGMKHSRTKYFSSFYLNHLL